MDFYVCKEEARKMLPRYLEEKGINVRRPFHCLNPDHHDNHPSMGLMKGRVRVHCLSCQATYDIFDLIGIDYGLSPSESTKMAFSMYNISMDQREKRFYLTREEAALLHICLPENIPYSVTCDRAGFLNIKRKSFNWSQFLSEQDMKRLVRERVSAMLERLQYSEKDVEADFQSLQAEYPDHDEKELYRISRKFYDKIDQDRAILKKLYIRAK